MSEKSCHQQEFRDPSSLLKFDWRKLLERFRPMFIFFFAQLIKNEADLAERDTCSLIMYHQHSTQQTVKTVLRGVVPLISTLMLPDIIYYESLKMVLPY